MRWPRRPFVPDMTAGTVVITESQINRTLRTRADDFDPVEKHSRPDPALGHRSDLHDLRNRRQIDRQARGRKRAGRDPGPEARRSRGPLDRRRQHSRRRGKRHQRAARPQQPPRHRRSHNGRHPDHHDAAGRHSRETSRREPRRAARRREFTDVKRDSHALQHPKPDSTPGSGAGSRSGRRRSDLGGGGWR